MTLRTQFFFATLTVSLFAQINPGSGQEPTIIKEAQETSALSELRAKAIAGDSDSQFKLGQMYFYGSSEIKKNSLEAVRWLRLASDQNNVRALVHLGDILKGRHPGYSTNYSEALFCYKKAGYLGNSNGAFWAGVMLEVGKEVPKDELEAIKWYRRASELGHELAQQTLRGNFNRDVLSRKWVDEEFIEWCRSLANKDFVEIQLLLGDILYGKGKRKDVTDEQWGMDQVEGSNWYLKVAKKGNSEGQFLYGVHYYIGGMPLDSDASDRRSTSRKVYKGGYISPISIVFDSKEAMKWLLKSAEQKYYPAQRVIGRLYLEGKGVEKSKTEAIKWFRLAASQGDEVSIDELKTLEKNKSSLK